MLLSISPPLRQCTMTLSAFNAQQTPSTLSPTSTISSCLLQSPISLNHPGSPIHPKHQRWKHRRRSQWVNLLTPFRICWRASFRIVRNKRIQLLLWSGTWFYLNFSQRNSMKAGMIQRSRRKRNLNNWRMDKARSWCFIWWIDFILKRLRLTSIAPSLWRTACYPLRMSGNSCSSSLKPSRYSILSTSSLPLPLTSISYSASRRTAIWLNSRRGARPKSKVT